MKLLGMVWWLGFWTALGLCIGSFLNVVIYRLPRGQSVGSPLWSACPYCANRIAWYDNLPILSFLFLGGRCRRCRAPIATRYLVVEAAMAIVVLLLLDAFFVGAVRAGLRTDAYGITDAIAYDWPIFLAHVILFACLLAMSAIDLEHYWVDIRFTSFVTITGFVLHTLWTPRYSSAWIRPMDGTAVVAMFVLIGLGVTWLVLATQEPFWEDDCEEAMHAEETILGGSPVIVPRAPALVSRSRMAGLLAVCVLIAMFAQVLLEGAGYRVPGTGLLRALPLVLLFLLIVSESAVARESDREIVEAIEEERDTARHVALMEFGLLLPAAVFGVIGILLMMGDSSLGDRLASGLHFKVGVSRSGLLLHWQPLWGFATAASGFIIAGAMGWIIRIFFTIAFGKEAFGTGDIHLMAATGCIAGWPVVALGFFLTCGISLFGWLVMLPFKRSRALPLGPWLSLSFLIVVLFYDSIVSWQPIQNAITVVDWFVLGNSQG